jgi:hypothetical protein
MVEFWTYNWACYLNALLRSILSRIVYIDWHDKRIRNILKIEHFKKHNFKKKINKNIEKY